VNSSEKMGSREGKALKTHVEHSPQRVEKPGMREVSPCGRITSGRGGMGRDRRGIAPLIVREQSDNL
jgi:hypothetical protein